MLFFLTMYLNFNQLDFFFESFITKMYDMWIVCDDDILIFSNTYKETGSKD